MAGDSLIERYLGTLERQLARRRDREDLVDEVSDHLHSAAERWEAAGVSRADAERRALQQFGRADLVASLVSTVPAASSTGARFLARHLMALSATTALLWLAVAAVGVSGLLQFRSFFWDDRTAMIAAVSLAVAALSTTTALLSLNVRATGEVDDPAMAIALIGIVASFLALTVPWLAFLWISLFTLTVVWTLVRTWRCRAGSRPVTLAMIVVLASIAGAALVVPIVSVAVGGITSDLLTGVLLFSGAGVLVVGFAEIAGRAASRTVRAKAVTA